MENSVDFVERIYDSRLGRWLTTYPLQEVYVSLSLYQFVANNPVCIVDSDGRKIRGKTKEGIDKEKIKYDKMRSSVANTAIQIENIYHCLVNDRFARTGRDHSPSIKSDSDKSTVEQIPEDNNVPKF